jgi:hypothetical protein
VILAPFPCPAAWCGETKCCSQKLAALVEHELLDHLVGSQQH